MNMSAGDDSVFGDSPQDPTHLSPETAAVHKAPERRDSGFAACRICHSGEMSAPFPTKGGRGEPLISPCRCTGTMGLYHRTCLERWLSTSNTDKCEICQFAYVVARKPESFFVVLGRDAAESRTERRNICGDLTCCACLTPLALTIAALCYQGGMHYLNSEEDSIQSPGLFAVAASLIFTWFIWFTVCISYHVRVWRQWRRQKLRVKLLSTPQRPMTPRLPLASIPEVVGTESESPLVPASALSPRSVRFRSQATEIPDVHRRPRRVHTPLFPLRPTATSSPTAWSDETPRRAGGAPTHIRMVATLLPMCDHAHPIPVHLQRPVSPPVVETVAINIGRR